MADDDLPWIELTGEDIERLAGVAEDTRAIAGELSIGVARPGERQRAGRRIDPAAAAVFFVWAQTMDPYGDDLDLPEQLQQVGRVYFAVDPSEGIAVWFGELPIETQAALEGKLFAALRDGWRRVLREQ
jgi:hypothetical protein